MIKKLNYILFVSLAVLSAGCNKFVDIKPEDSYVDEQVFNNAATIRQAINGIYTGLADDKLYGANLTMEAVDIIGKRYNTNNVLSMWEDIANNYGVQGEPRSTFDALWTAAYAQILSINKFIEQLTKVKSDGLITEAQASQLLGEATGLRAFVHFDLLRLYGPQYSGNDEALAIPYYTVPDGKVQPVLKFGEVAAKVLADLTAAGQLLANDPVITKGVSTTGTPDYYTGFRNRRMNYYAVKALTARFYLYTRKRELAYATAKEVITKADNTFPWTPYTSVVGAANPDRIFSSEVILGFINPNLYLTHNRIFSSSLYNGALLAPTASQLTTAYQGNENDYRYNSSWFISSYGYRTFYKYADITDQNASWRFFQPLIRKSEMYYILAETEPDKAMAIQYLNTVRANRGLVNLATSALITGRNSEIEKEYIKEFYGEGQMYFFYKRLNNPSWGGLLSTQVPIPVSESSLR